MGRRRNRGDHESKSGSSEWMTTYGDMVTLLLTFFIMLFSFSTIDAQKWQALVSSFQGNISVFEGGIDFTPKPGSDNSIISEYLERREKDGPQSNQDEQEVEVDSEFLQLYRRIEQYIEHNSIQAEVDISKTHTEILIRFRNYILFDVGKADIRSEAEVILDDIAGVLLEFDAQIQQIRVDGHTDSTPINTQTYPTNWELSGGRAARVVRYFQEKHRFPGEKLSFAGFGEYSSIDSNETIEGRSRNRRVDILIVRRVNDIEYID